MTKNIVIAVLATIVLGFTALLILGLYMESQPISSEEVPSGLVQSDVQYEDKDVFKREYMKGCDTSGVDTAYCECTYNYLSSRYSINQMAQMGLDYENTGELTNEMYAAVEACL